MPSVSWLSWSADAFARARAERKPVLLSIGTGWSHACRAMDVDAYGDPAVAALVAERFIPVRVDADRRPDISDRYTLGGWPTTAFLTDEGAVVGGGTFIAPERMVSVLQTMADAFDTRATEIAARARSADALTASPPVPAPAAIDEQALTQTVFASFDEEHGGFGMAPKLPLAAPIRLALHLHRDHPDERLAHIAAASLDAMGWGPLHDEIDGGFYRCSEAPGWADPHLEKLLDVNASLIDLYVEAAAILGAERYADRAQDALRFAQNWLADQVDGGWAGSQRVDAASRQQPRPSALPAGLNRRPAVDRTLYASWNGTMVSAALRAAHAFQDDALGRFALTSLERVIATCYKPGDGIAHYVFGGMRTSGMLDDQIAIATACLDAFEATGNIVYQMMAEELAHHARRTMWDNEWGAFCDRTVPAEREHVGLMRQRLIPFVANCEAATLLSRLAASGGNREFAATAESALAAISSAASAHGPYAAHYLLARRSARAGDTLPLL